ncbi:MAG: hypothetical protein IPM70_13775 [Proteobacteria bacterium]|nr:hypothetical protein [Pseudomonadota bacterium]
MKFLSALVVASCILSGNALAHHSFAMFDNDKQIRLVGTVTEFRWQNPHVYIHLEAPDPKGKMRH